MKLRDRQVVFCDRVDAALAARGNTIGVAPTGAGKTLMFSEIIRRARPRAGLVLQHRDELVRQNRTAFELVAPGVSTGLYTADRKEWGYGVTFAMVNTLAGNLDAMPALDFMAIDEGHHAAAPTYQRVIAEARRRNPAMKLLLVTATPNRGDKKALRGVVDNCADQITLLELIRAGHLVPPRPMVVDLGVREELSRVRTTAADFDMVEVEAIMDKQILNDRIVEEWKAKAGDRRTVVFCSTVKHAQHVTEAFVAAGVSARLIHGEMGDGERRQMVREFDAGVFQVIVNVAVLTEGWDCQPVSCVVLLRPTSYKSTMIQMIGRGLRKVDPERYPGIRKDDCIVIDFGTSILRHASIEQIVNIDQKGTKECPDCHATVPMQATDCAICGYEWPLGPDDAMGQQDSALEALIAAGEGGGAAEKDELEHFRLTEISLFDASPFRWEPIFEGLVMVATAFEASAMCVNYGGRWHALGKMQNKPITLLADTNDKLIALATADDYLRQFGDNEAAGKGKRWLHQPASEAQLQRLGMAPQAGLGMTKYQASCHLEWRFSEAAVRRRLEMTRQLAA